jgi:hypothetical protein
VDQGNCRLSTTGTYVTTATVMAERDSARRGQLPMPDQAPTVGFKFDVTDPGKGFPDLEPIRPPAA